jgi:hypothetical protein
MQLVRRYNPVAAELGDLGYNNRALVYAGAIHSHALEVPRGSAGPTYTLAGVAQSLTDQGRLGLYRPLISFQRESKKFTLWPRWSRVWPRWTLVVAEMVVAEMVCGRDGCNSIELSLRARLMRGGGYEISVQMT